jgi:hypothetical protein
LADILFIKAFESMGLDRRTLEPAGNSLFGFGGKKTDALGKKAILVSFEEGEKVRTETITFDVVNMDYPYTAIFSSGFTNKFEVTIKQSYLCMKMSSPFRVIMVHGDQLASRRIEGRSILGYSLVNEVTKKKQEEEQNSEKTVAPRAKPAEDTKKTPLSKSTTDKCVHIGTDLPAQDKQKLIEFLYENSDVFAWSASDLQGVSRNLAQHNLNVAKNAKPQKQKLRKILTERAEAVKVEVQRLIEAGVIRPVQYPEWLANVVMVKKKNGKWRMCVDFTDHNKHCLKDPYPLPRIDKLVDIAAGYEVMSLLNCFSGYHQIWLNPEDKEKTNFINPGGTYCYRHMPEGL